MKQKKFKEYKKCTEPVYLAPDCMRETIPVHKLSVSGIFQIENKKDMNVYDKLYTFSDTNYNLKDDDDKGEDLDKWIKLLQAMRVSFKVISVNAQRDREIVEKENQFASIHAEPFYEILANAFSQHVKECREKGNKNIENRRLAVISCVRHDIEEAKLYFNNIENTLIPAFQAMGSQLVPADAVDRLKELHDIFRPGKEREFGITWEKLKNRGEEWKNEIAPLSIQEYPDHLEVDDLLACVLLVRSYPDSLRDGFISRLTTSLSFPIAATVDMSPIPKEITKKRLQKALLNTEGAIDRQQINNNKRGAFTTEPSRDRRTEKDSLNEDLEEVERNDQKMIYTNVLVLVTGKDMQELKSRIERVKQVGESDDVVFDIYYNQQLNAYKTALPTATRLVNNMRPLFTTSLAALCPFNVSDISMKNGFVYGTNFISKNMIRADRGKLKNGNAFIYAPSGSGKSVFVKAELGQVLAYTQDDVLLLDPNNEYFEICELAGGQVLDFTSGTETFINPLQIPDMVFEENSLRLNFISQKGEFMQSLFRYVKKSELEGNEQAIVDRCARILFEETFSRFDETGERTEPTFREYQEVLGREKEKAQVEKLLDAMDLYVNGSLNIFSHPSNVDIQNRVIDFGIKNLGDNIKKPAILIITEIMTSRLTYNSRQGKATRVYADEIHYVFDDDEFVRALDKLWKVARKDGGMATGITQNISDSSMVASARKMVANSEMLVLLSLSKTDREDLHQIVDVNPAEMEYLKNRPQGIGLMKFGGTKVVFDNRLSKDNLLYWLYTTDPKDKGDKERVMQRLKSQIRQMGRARREEERESLLESKRLADSVIERMTKEAREMEEARKAKEAQKAEGARKEEEAREAEEARKVEEAPKDLEKRGLLELLQSREGPATPGGGILEEEPPLFCPSCGIQVSKDWRFCRDCGKSLLE